MEAKLQNTRGSWARRPPSRLGERLPLRPMFMLTGEPTECFASSLHLPHNVASTAVGRPGLFRQPPKLFCPQRSVCWSQAEFFSLAFSRYFVLSASPFLCPSPPFSPPPFCVRLHAYPPAPFLSTFRVLGGCIASPSVSRSGALSPSTGRRNRLAEIWGDFRFVLWFPGVSLEAIL